MNKMLINIKLSFGYDESIWFYGQNCFKLKRNLKKYINENLSEKTVHSTTKTEKKKKKTVHFSTF